MNVATRRGGSLAALAAALVLTAAIAGCTGDEPEPEPVEQDAASDEPEPEPEGPREGGTLRVGLVVDPVSIDPRYVLDDPGELVVGAVFDPLVRLDASGDLEPAAAAAWEISDDGRTFTFELAEDGRFHDGEPVLAEDVVRGLRAIADGSAEQPSFLAYLLAPVEGFDDAQAGGELSGVEAVDERTVVITLDEPDPGFLSTLADPSLVPLPEAALEDPDDFASQLIGNGPFALAGPREPGAFIRLVADRDHPRPPLVDEVVLTVYADDADGQRQWDDVSDGQLHLATLGPERQADAIARFGRSSDGYAGPGVIDGIATTVYLYGFDTTRAPFDDPRIRRAISLSIDRERLADEVMRGTRAPADALVPPPVPGARPGTCTACRHDPDEARALVEEVEAERLEEARAAAEAERDDADGDEDAADDASAEQDGADDDDATDDVGDEDDAPPVEVDPVLEELVLTHTRGATHAAIAEAMAEDIRDALGVEVSFVARDLERLIAGVRAGEVDAFRFGWDSNELDPATFLRPLFHSENLGLDNLTRYEEPEVDEALDAARAMPRSPERLTAYRLAERRILEDLPAMPLLFYRHQFVVAEDVRELVVDPTGRIDLTTVWLDPEPA